jgi:hypothetical protein
MSKAYSRRMGVSYRRNAVWTPSSASLVAVVFLGFLIPTTDGPAALREFSHPDTCRVCAASTPEARAVIDATLIASGAMEAPNASESFSKGSGPISWAAPTGARWQADQRPAYPEGGDGAADRTWRAPTTARYRTATEQQNREK